MNEIKDSTIKSHIVGIGGIFFKSKDPDKLIEWYKSVLGFEAQVPYSEDDTAITFKWKSSNGTNQNTVWAPFKEDTNYFDPSDRQFMINYIVKDIEGLISKLKAKGIKPINKIRKYPYGRFASILDIENNKIEFWEPDKEFFQEKYYQH